MFNFNIESLEFSGKDIVELEQNSLTILIGPNSAGKSTALKDIEHHLQGGNQSKVVIKCNRKKEGDYSEFKKWLGKNYYSREDATDKQIFVTKSQEIRESNIPNAWSNNINQVIRFLCDRLDTKTRLNITTVKNSINPFEQTPSEYIHMLQANDKLANEISKEINDSFENEIIINRSGSGNIWFNVGIEPERTVENDRASSKYLKELNKLPKLDEEGDGIQSFTGCLLAVKCGAHPILLIDEPEAFLHPAQARRLGRILAESAKQLKRQIIISTHSSEIIQGALSSKGEVSVCRLTKENNSNYASIFNSRELKKLWSKPLLQSSGAIDGIFHKGVIICEADSDCRFFESLLKAKEENGDFTKPADLYFIHGGGKGEIATLTRSYKTLKVSCSAIADFDILRNKAEFKNLYSAFGGDFESIEADYNSATSALNDLSTIKSIPDFLSEMELILDKIKKSKTISNKNKEAISQYLSESSKWSSAKKYGISKLRGSANKSCKRILASCKSIGLFIIPNGELESFWGEGSSTKSEWILEALEEISKNPETFDVANNFLDELCKYLGIK